MNRGVASRVRAFETNDIDALVSLLRDDIRTTMPPSPTWIETLPANRAFYAAMFDKLWRGAVKLVPTAANGQTAFGFYRSAAPGEAHVLRAIEVISVRESRIVGIDHFMMPWFAPTFSLPMSVEPSTCRNAREEA